ncbi:GntR family transcriptional regulator [Streptomyces sp. H10-C2]|uniref:GntR family transcriptional regulator n=1 Tax=unclassified Streptomyces TaxID=2593676 RepID=UPI0024BB1461|nr:MULTISPECIES: GntR family transcriptional regulator [unclassified Streptomyces]MDJ0345683.1 GntR family transcriptional regulator [Streptomyces sp. PH10-H1]MDJ0374535.1 GntR family transcriptional regulator [Streptomyces sp. H10-C2]
MPAAAMARHRRIAADLRRRIAAGDWRPGEQIPSRADLGVEYRVHEQTIRLAIVLLRQEGVLDSEQRQRPWVAHPPAVRTLTNPDAPWPYGSETTDTTPVRATADLAAGLDVPLGVRLQTESLECWDPQGRSSLLITSWWRGTTRKAHAGFTVEVDTVALNRGQAEALRLPIDTIALLLVRTRLDAQGGPVETADLILPRDRWRLRWGNAHDRSG